MDEGGPDRLSPEEYRRLEGIPDSPSEEQLVSDVFDQASLRSLELPDLPTEVSAAIQGVEHKTRILTSKLENFRKQYRELYQEYEKLFVIWKTMGDDQRRADVRGVAEEAFGQMQTMKRKLQELTVTEDVGPIWADIDEAYHLAKSKLAEAKEIVQDIEVGA